MRTDHEVEEAADDIAVRNIARARAILGHDRVSALMTTTERSLTMPRDIVDEYRRLEFDGSFYGRSARSASRREGIPIGAMTWRPFSRSISQALA